MTPKIIVFSNQSSKKEEFFKHITDIAVDQLSKLKEESKLEQASPNNSVFKQGDIVVEKTTGKEFTVLLSGDEYTLCSFSNSIDSDQVIPFKTSNLSLVYNETDENYLMELPCQFQIGDSVLFIPAPHKLKNNSIENVSTLARIVGVQFASEITYDLIIHYENDSYYDDIIEKVHHSKIFPLSEN